MIDNFTREYAFLSNYYTPCRISYRGRTYWNSESAYQAQKCADDSEKDLFTGLYPDDAKRLGSHVKIVSNWDEVKADVMREIIRAKFAQHPELAEKLHATGDEMLVEGNTWHDNFFGNCTCKGCRGIVGQNWLGRILMEERRRLEGD